MFWAQPRTGERGVFERDLKASELMLASNLSAALPCSTDGISTQILLIPELVADADV